MIELKNVTKYFKTEGEKKYILKNITFTIPDKINLGILGRNGAGKSTFLRMLGGIDFPTVGEIKSNQSFSWPMGLAGGFQGSMTGRQNVKFVCRIYGKGEAEIEKVMKYVQEFAEIGDYFDMPIKIYSSGMRSRLSFGLSLAFDFDYLIIDETLSVGDENFKNKAKKALAKKIENCNILLVSHSMADLKKLCNAGVVLENGELFYFENIDDAIKHYHEINQQVKTTKQVVQSSAIYCEDGRVFDTINEAAAFYKLRPLGFVQALEHNNGSHAYLKKVFYKDGLQKKPFQKFENCVPMQTLITSDGVIHETIEDALSFYQERFKNANVTIQDLKETMQSQEKVCKKINVKFYYLSEYE